MSLHPDPLAGGFLDDLFALWFKGVYALASFVVLLLTFIVERLGIALGDFRPD